MEQPLLNSRPMRRSLAPIVLVLATLCAPASVEAQLTPMFTAFGTHGANSNLQTQPLGASDCSTAIPFTFSPTVNSSTTRYIDVWSASSNTAGCQQMMVRSTSTNTACTYLTSYSYIPVNMTATPAGITPNTLFAGCSNSTRTFYFFDTASEHNTTDSFTTYWTITAQLSATAPTAPAIAGTPAGDAQIQINWNATAFTGLGTMGQVYVFAAAGCAGATTDGNGADAGTTTSTLVAAGPAPGTHLLASSATSPITVSTSAFGWSSGSYGETVSVAIATVDSAGNVSPLSNVVCVQHVLVTGFWEQYCAEHGMPDVAQCTANYHGCSVGLPGRRVDLSAVAFALGVGAVVIARRGRRRSR